VDCDLVIRGGLALTPDELIDGDVAVADGSIAAVGAGVSGEAREEIDATGMYVLPGGIDMHVHCDEPGRTDWEGFATATAALAVGGFTAFADMPLNSTPATVDVEAFDRKVKAAQVNSRIDFALWGGLVPGKLGQLEAMHGRGAIGFKAFMSETGMDDFRPADDDTLLEGMRAAASLGALVAVHAENDTIVSARRDRAVAARRLDARSHLASRPSVAELEAITRAVTFAGETGCRPHIVHVSTAEGVELIRSARADGVDVSWETAKVTDDFFSAWGGINGCQSTLNVLLERIGDGRLGLAAASAAVSANVATRLGLPRQGTIESGCDADLAVVDLDREWTLTGEELRYRHRVSALIGQPMRGGVRDVLNRGRAVVSGGAIVDDVRGQLIRPAV
jgi:allantoinase